MFLINDILVSDELLEKKFCCNLAACHGACCVEGDFGAPLEPQEREILREILDDVMPVLDEESQNSLREQGVDTYYPGMNDHGTSFGPVAAYPSTIFDVPGTAICRLDTQYREGLIAFTKPLRCELYPIRVNRNRETGFLALNFDEWSICKPALDQCHRFLL